MSDMNTNQTKIEIEILLKEKYNSKKTDSFFADSERIKHGEPLAYIIGHIPFLSTTIYLDSFPLIPRTETEFWVENVIKSINTLYRGRTPVVSPVVLDLCAGSGCIGVSVLKEVENSHVDFVEIDERHQATIQKNISKNDIDPSRINIYSGNLFDNLPKFSPCPRKDIRRGEGKDIRQEDLGRGEKKDTRRGERNGLGQNGHDLGRGERNGLGWGELDKYDFILTNPPYIDKELDRTEISVKKYEPDNALYGGNFGMEIIEEIITKLPKYLKKNGCMYIEHEPEQTKKIHRLGIQEGFVSKTFVDQYNVKRYTQLTHT